ncbi:MAG: hypothetical protein H0U74_07960 [Bradymonadaceae bacterium]|nr:hypothetical protein [Lujinxingiaceae bacterium]
MQASLDLNLIARVVRTESLYYHSGADPLLDQPAHVRAGSALVRVGSKLAVIQDDANFIALVELPGLRTEALVLPAGPGGLRLFGDDRGNKADKWDLEAALSIEDAQGTTLVAFGSGSSARRFYVVIVRWTSSNATPQVSVVHRPAFYQALLDDRAFSGAALNIEGAALSVDGQSVHLFQRGNGDLVDGVAPVNAVCTLDWAPLHAHLLDANEPLPRLRDVVQYALGSVGGVSLSFTDATNAGPHLIYCAAAEDTPDTYSDGPVVGTALGVITGGETRYTPLLDAEDRPFLAKIEGVLLIDEKRAFVVTDRDDPELPSQLCEVELDGPWFNGWV